MIKRTLIQIDQFNLNHNLNLVKQMAPDSNIIAMVKANAYGCGLKSVLPIFNKQVCALGIACLNEALVIRQLGYHTPCILFQGVFSSEEYELIDSYGFELVIHSEQQLQQFLSYPFKNRIRCWLKIDTGMHRLGLSIDDVPNAIKLLTNSSKVDRPIGIMSHFACSNQPEHELNKLQIKQFESIRTLLGTDYIYSLSNSGAIISQNHAHYDMVRAGIMLYGGSPLSGHIASDIGIKPVNHFHSRIMSIKTVGCGETVGYGAIWTAKQTSQIALVGAGYGDGYPRHINDKAYVAVNNQFATIVGRISMDMMAIDVTELSDIEVGDKVELWGDNVSIDHVANWAGTISYELLCQLQHRVEPV